MNTIKRLCAEYRRVSATLAAVLLVLLLVTVSNLFSGLPHPKRPSPDLFASPDGTSWTLQNETNGVFTAFSERPLFSATRRIRVRPPAPEAAPKPEPTGPILSLDQWSLLGIVDSGEVEGALIRHPNSGRHRLVVGEQLDGWELTSVDPRSIRFKSVAGGAQAELSMVLATVEVLPVPEPSESSGATGMPTAAQSTTGRQQESEAVTEPGEAADTPEIITPSFEDFYGGPRTKQDKDT